LVSVLVCSEGSAADITQLDSMLLENLLSLVVTVGMVTMSTVFTKLAAANLVESAAAT